MVQIEAIAVSQKQLLQKPTCTWIRWVQNHLLLLLVLSTQAVLGGQIVKYINVDDSELFYYFIKSEGNPQDDPLFLCLTGGPGCTSFSGLLYEVGTLKLNTDGYSKGDPGQVGYGGLLRDETETWIWGYYGNLGHCSAMEAELWAIYRGLTILFQKGIMNVAIETDAAQAIDLIQNGPSHNSPFKALIEDTKFLMARCTCTLGHTLREGNRAADMLANLGVAQTEHVVMLEDPPEAARALVVEDMIGVSSVRV